MPTQASVNWTIQTDTKLDADTQEIEQVQFIGSTIVVYYIDNNTLSLCIYVVNCTKEGLSLVVQMEINSNLDNWMETI